MSLTRFLPTPSDRMGILWTLLQIRDAVILEYGTAGTTAYAKKTFGMMGMNTDRLFATGLDENCVVMGDTSALEAKIRELDRKYRPQTLFVMASSVSSVTGADVAGVCSYMQDEVSAKLVVFEQGGFGGDFSLGIKSCYTKLATELAKENFEREDSYNILGISAMSKSARGDVALINKLMRDNFGLKPHTVLCFETELEKISSMSKARLNLVLSYEALDTAKLLEARFGTPYVYALPIGRDGTDMWLGEIARVLGADFRPQIAEKPSKTGQNVLIYAGYDKAIALKTELRKLGYEQIETICTHKIKKHGDIIFIKKEREKIELFRSAKNTLIFADSTFLNLANSSNKKINIDSVATILGHSTLEKMI